MTIYLLYSVTTPQPYGGDESCASVRAAFTSQAKADEYKAKNPHPFDDPKSGFWAAALEDIELDPE